VETSLPQTLLNCTQCGGELHPDEGKIFITCPFCNSTVFLDKSQVVFHWFIAPTLDEGKARASLARWMSSSQTVKDLDRKSKISEAGFSYFPLWYFKLGTAGGKEQMAIRPAAATAVSEIRNLRLPAGDLRRFAAEVESQSAPPSVPLQAAREWVTQEAGSENSVLEQSLVHIPLYTFKYSYQGGEYTAVVEGATGEVFANIYPAKAETPYRLVGFISALVFLCLALFPIAGALAGETEGAGVGLLLCGGIGLVAGPVLFALAVWVAAKI
jgi:DNA-directed RNA polymerase subunit RPC12/RpoP